VPAVTAFAVHQDIPQAVQLAVLAQQMTAAEEGGGDIPDSHFVGGRVSAGEGEGRARPRSGALAAGPRGELCTLADPCYMPRML
jgi:hypothetical protein